MLNQISNLGTRLSKKELKNVLGGSQICGGTKAINRGPCDGIYCSELGTNCYNGVCWICL